MAKNKVSLDVIDSILGGGNEAPQESNGHVEAEAAPTPQKKGKGRPKEEEYEARTFRVKTELVKKLKIIALKEGRLQKDILDYALESTIARYEEKNGVIDIEEYEKKEIADLF